MPALDKRLADARSEFDARKKSLEADYDEWLSNAEEQAKEATFWSGAWYSAGPFSFTRDGAKQIFEPEKHPVILSDSFDNGRLHWRLRLDYRDAASNQFVDGSTNAVNYLYRRILSPQDYTLNVSLCAGNGASSGSTTNSSRRLRMTETDPSP